MNKEDVTQIVNQLITDGKQKEALEILAAYVSGKDRYIENDLLLQTASFNRNKRDYNNNLISREDYITALARLNNAINQILELLPAIGNAIMADSISGMGGSKKILFLSASPKNTTQLRLGEELRKIKDSLAAATERARFSLESEPAVQISTITGAMQKQKPQIVHFSGHGSGEDGILVEGPAGGTVYFPTNGLDRLFRIFKDTVECVVLNACFSREQAEVISAHGIYVVGMNDAIGDKAAIDFAVGFYQSLGEGNNFEFAFDIAMVTNSANINHVNTPELWLNGKKLPM